MAIDTCEHHGELNLGALIMDGQTPKVNPADTAITVDDLTFAYLAEPVLQAVSFTLEKGAIGLLGPNGSGKTTLLRALLGQLKVPPGKVRVLGHDMAQQAREARTRLGWMPETGGTIPGMSGVGLVAYLGELSGMPPRDAMQRAHEVLHYVGLADERYRKCDDYSQGMKQRLKLAQALVHDPDWLLLDEPTSGLDPKGRVAILELIRDLAWHKNLGVILSTHLLPDVEATCREILVLRRGRVLARQEVDQDSRALRQVFELEGSGDEDAFVSALESVAAAIERDGRLILVTMEFEPADLTRSGADAAEGDAADDGATTIDATSLGVRRILQVADEHEFSLRRLRRRPVSLADEFYELVQE